MKDELEMDFFQFSHAETEFSLEEGELSSVAEKIAKK